MRSILKNKRMEVTGHRACLFDDLSASDSGALLLTMKLLVIDDAVQIREGIKEGIDWKDYGIEAVYTASDGKEGYTLFMEYLPEIVLTDIRMSGYDGLQLTEKIQIIQPKTRVIIMSAYSEFEYAQRALQLHVTDFVLKPIKVKRLIEVVFGAIKAYQEICERDQQERQFQILYREKQLNELLTVQTNSNKNLCEEFLEAQNIKKTDLIVCMALQCDKRQAMTAEEESCYMANEKLAAMLCDLLEEVSGICFSKVSQSMIALFKLPQSILYKTYIKSKLGKILQQINQTVGAELGCTFSIGISDYGYASDLKKLFMQAVDSLENRLYLGKGIVTDYQKVFALKNEMIIKDDLEDRIGSLLDLMSWEELEKYVCSLYEDIRQKAIWNKKSVIAFSEEILQSVYHQMKIKNVAGIPFLLEQLELFKTKADYALLVDYQNKLLEIMRQVFFTHSNVQGLSNNSLILKTRYFIDNNYQKDILARDVAEYIGITPNYFSHLFKKEFHISFKEYLNSVRIKQAQKLLQTTNMRAWEVAEAVGFKNYKYFNQIFKKHTGHSSCKRE